MSKFTKSKNMIIKFCICNKVFLFCNCFCLLFWCKISRHFMGIQPCSLLFVEGSQVLPKLTKKKNMINKIFVLNMINKIFNLLLCYVLMQNIQIFYVVPVMVVVTCYFSDGDSSEDNMNKESTFFINWLELNSKA